MGQNQRNFRQVLSKLGLELRKSPAFDIERRKRFPIGSIEVRFNVQEGKITEAKIYGDFFGLGDIADVEQAFIGTRYDKSALKDVIDQIDVKNILAILP